MNYFNCELINTLINYIMNGRNNINKCITWCQKFNISCNKHLLVSNIYDEYSEQSSTINL